MKNEKWKSQKEIGNYKKWWIKNKTKKLLLNQPPTVTNTVLYLTWLINRAPVPIISTIIGGAVALAMRVALVYIAFSGARFRAHCQYLDSYRQSHILNLNIRNNGRRHGAGRNLGRLRQRKELGRREISGPDYTAGNRGFLQTLGSVCAIQLFCSRIPSLTPPSFNQDVLCRRCA